MCLATDVQFYLEEIHITFKTIHFTTTTRKKQNKFPMRQFQTTYKETLGTNFRPVHHFVVTKSVTFQKSSRHKMAADLRRVRHRRFRYLAVHSKLAFVATLLLSRRPEAGGSRVT